MLVHIITSTGGTKIHRHIITFNGRYGGGVTKGFPIHTHHQILTKISICEVVPYQIKSNIHLTSGSIFGLHQLLREISRSLAAKCSPASH